MDDSSPATSPAVDQRPPLRPNVSSYSLEIGSSPSSLLSTSPPFPEVDLSNPTTPKNVGRRTSSSIFFGITHPELWGHEHETPSPAETSYGFASVRVGLGSPNLALKKEWLHKADNHNEESAEPEKKVDEGSDTPSEQIEGEGQAYSRRASRTSIIDTATGLPSPPPTDVSIIEGSAREGSFDRNQPTSPLPSKLPGPSRRISSGASSRPASNHTGHCPLPRRVSSSASSRPASIHADQSSAPSHHSERSPYIYSETSSRRSSQADSRRPSSLEPPVERTNGNDESPAVMRRGGSRLQSPSPTREASSSRVSPSRHIGTSSGVASPRRSPRRRSPTSSTIASPEPTRKRSDVSHASTSSMLRESSLVQESLPQGNSDKDKSSSLDETLDERIRAAEEKLRSSSIRHLRERSPRPPSLHRHDSYSRQHSSPLTANGATIRRSATLSSASAMTPNGDYAERFGPGPRISGLDESVHERERSGGSGSSGKRKPLPSEFRNGGLFTPSPKGNNASYSVDVLDVYPLDPRLMDSPSAHSPEIPSSSHLYSRSSSLLNSHTSPTDRFRPQPSDRTLNRASSLAQRGERSEHAKRQWAESVSGLPNSRQLDEGRSPLSRRSEEAARSQSVVGTSPRYQRRGGSGESVLSERGAPATMFSERNLGSFSRGSRLALGPSDSISAIGMRGDTRQVPSPRKDPLDIVRRMEESRAERQRAWEVERSASVLGDLHAFAPRHDGRTPSLPRPTTSMSSIRDHYDAPRTAPVERLRSRNGAAHEHSPLSIAVMRRHEQGPATEPRPMRSSTSLGVRAKTRMEMPLASTEHGRLLFEAVRSLELKLGPDALQKAPDLQRCLQASAQSCEAVNGSIRQALQVINDVQVRLEVEGVARCQDDLSRLGIILRDATRSSDQNIRDLTRALLDLPKVFRSGAPPLLAPNSRSRHEGTGDQHDPIKPSPLSTRDEPRRWTPASPIDRFDDSTVRRSVDMARPSTSMAEMQSPTARYSLDSGARRAVLQPRSRDKDRSSTMSNLVAKVRSLSPKKHSNSELVTIEQSPPQMISQPASFDPSDVPRPASITGSAFSATQDTPAEPLKSPEHRNVLKKKASAASNHTVKGSSFHPISGLVRTTTAISTITVGDLEHLPTSDAKSIRSLRSLAESTKDGQQSSPSRYSFNFRKGAIAPRKSFDNEAREAEAAKGMMEDAEDESDGERDGEDAISELEQNLALAAKRRDEVNGRASMDSEMSEDRLGHIEEQEQNEQTRIEAHKRGHGHSDPETQGQFAGQKQEEGKPSLSERFKATLRRGSSLRVGKE